jgi:hypothetical protein
MSAAEEIEQRQLETLAMGHKLVALAGELAAMECEWLATLWEFNLRGGWADGGEVSCADWLVSKCGLSPVTAREKIRVAHELSRRPAIRAAFAAGMLSYTKVRAITRINAEEETDRWLLKLAEKGTAADLEVAVRHYQELRDQEEPVDNYLRRWDKAAVRSTRTFDGMAVLETVAPIEEGQEILALLRAAEAKGPVDSAESTGQRRLRALLDLLRAGAAHLDTSTDTSGSDRYTLHAVADVSVLAGSGEGRAELLDGTSVAPETVQRWTCDSAIIRHVVKGESEPIDIGRKSKVWTTAQRRAIIVRDHGRCRWPNCWRRIADIHHVIWFDQQGGITAVSNGCLLCPHHHTYVHEGGFKITGEPNSTLKFWRPDGELIGASCA